MTKVVDFAQNVKESPIQGIQYKIKQRSTPPVEWFDDSELKDRFSGTLIKSKRLGFKIDHHAKEEALAQVLGYAFEIAPASRVQTGSIFSEGDCHAITEAGWHIDRFQSSDIFGDKFEAVYITVTDSDNTTREGLAVIVTETTIQWAGNGNVIFAILTEFNNKTGMWETPINPF